MTRQEMFDTMVRGLRAQKKFSFDESDGCCYRGCNGLRCAVGFLIPDDKYQPNFDDGIGSIKNVGILTGLWTTEDDISFLTAAQNTLHDNLADDLGGKWSPEEFENATSRFAEKFELEVPQ